MFVNLSLRVLGKADNVREVRTDAVRTAQTNDVPVRLRPVLPLVGRQQRVPIEGFDADEHLETPGLRQEIDQVLLPGDLRIALNEELQTEPFLDHRREKFLRFRILIEVVGSEHDGSDSGGPGGAETGQRGVDTLATDSPPGNFRDRAEVAEKRTPARG